MNIVANLSTFNPTEISSASLCQSIIDEAKRIWIEEYGKPEPSADHLAGWRPITTTISDMAVGTISKSDYFLSSLPTGMGKTTLTVAAARVITQDPALSHVGIIVLVNYLDLIPKLIEAMGFEVRPGDHCYAVVVGKDNIELNRLGNSDPRKAQVLFMTQAKLTHWALYHRNFETNKHLFYLNQPRAVRIWDEAIAPIDPIMLTTKDVERGVTKLRGLRLTSAADAIEVWSNALPNVPDNSCIAIPDFMLDSSFSDIERIPKGVTEDEDVAIVWKLVRLNGKEVRLHQDQAKGITTISYLELLPTNLEPALILDARGGFREVYKEWKRGRGNLEMLPSPQKTYRNLKIHFYDCASGLNAHRDVGKRQKLIDAALDAFRHTAPEPILFVVRKTQERWGSEQVRLTTDMEILIREAIEKDKGDVSRAHFVTYGKHTAPNDYQDIKHVCAIGAFQKPMHKYIADHRGASMMAPNMSTDYEAVKRVRWSDAAHEFYQAAGRIAIRDYVNGDVPEGCTLWIVFATGGYMDVPRTILDWMFDQAPVIDWYPGGRKLRGGKLKTDNRPKFVEAILATNGQWFERKALFGFSAPMSQRFLNDDAVHDALTDRGYSLEAVRTKRGRAYYLRYRLVRQEKKRAA